MTARTPTRFTIDDLLRLGSDVWAEVINGELIVASAETPLKGENRVMGPVGFLHGPIAGNVYDVLKPYAAAHKLGYVLGDGVIYSISYNSLDMATRKPM